MVGKKYNADRIVASKIGKKLALKNRIEQRLEPISEKLKKYLDFGMSNVFIYSKTNIKQADLEYYKKLNYPNGLPWQCNFVESWIDISAIEEMIKLTKLKMRYKRIAKAVGVHHKIVRRILNILNKRDPEIVCHSYDADRWSFSISSIEVKIKNLLEELKEPYEQQYCVAEKSNMPYDFRVKGINLLIEVNGDYFHCNPVIYKNPINDYQKWAQRRDFFKKDLAKRNGFFILTIWENDIKKNFENVIITLKERIEKCKLQQQLEIL